MNLDALLLVVLALCLLAGILRGFLRQATATAALLVGLAAAWIAAAFLGPALPWGPPGAAAVAVFIAVSFAASRIGGRIVREKAIAFSGGTADRLFGGAFSLLEGLAVLLLVIWLFDAVCADYFERHPGAAERWRGSRLVRMAAARNPVARRGPVIRLRGFFEAVRDPDARENLRSQPAFAAMTGNPRYRAVREDEGVEGDIERRKWAKVLADPAVRTLLADGRFWSDALEVRWEAALDPRPPTPAPTPPPEPTPTPPEPTPTPEPTGTPRRDLATVILRSGSVLTGTIVRRDAAGLLLDVPLDGGSMRMRIGAAEIERVETPGAVPPPLP
ncbi:MAG: CvpA family protein [bacterium]|nr:CvpA family protein [bacterium]